MILEKENFLNRKCVFWFSLPILIFAIPKCLTHINIQWSIIQTEQNIILFIIVLGQHVSILIESSSGPSKKIVPYLAMFEM